MNNDDQTKNDKVNDSDTARMISQLSDRRIREDVQES